MQLNAAYFLFKRVDCLLICNCKLSLCEIFLRDRLKQVEQRYYSTVSDTTMMNRDQMLVHKQKKLDRLTVDLGNKKIRCPSATDKQPPCKKFIIELLFFLYKKPL